MIHIQKLNLHYGQTQILSDLTVQFDLGIHSIIGRSGSGKTSLLRCLAGLETYTGQISGIQSNQLGYMEQQMTLFPHLTVEANVAYPLQIRHQPKAAIRSAVTDMLNRCLVTQHAKRYPHELSGGEQRRVMLARSLVYTPTVLLCDEPFSALDALTRVELVRWFKQLVTDQSMIVLYVTHDLAEARFLSTDALILEQGKTVVQGNWSQLNHPLLDVHF